LKSDRKTLWWVVLEEKFGRMKLVKRKKGRPPRDSGWNGKGETHAKTNGGKIGENTRRAKNAVKEGRGRGAYLNRIEWRLQDEKRKYEK